jgi:hypothetical protein
MCIAKIGLIPLPTCVTASRAQLVRVPLIKIETPRSGLWLWVFSFRVLDSLTHCGEGPSCQTTALSTVATGCREGKAVAVPSGSGIDAFTGRHESTGGSA